MARNTRLATTITARYTASVGAVDAFYMDGRSNSRRETQFADLTLDREDRGSFFAVYASSHGVRDAMSGDDGNRTILDKICDDMKKNKHRNIDEEINDLAECAVNVAGRLTLSDGAVRQPYFAGIIIKDGEMAAITLGRGCCYLYRDDALYPLTQDDFELEPVDHYGRRVSNMDDFAAGVAGTIRYSNIAQLKPDDSIILCNRELMEAIGQHQMLRILAEAEDQAEAAGTIMDIATEELPHISLQFMISFVDDVITIDRLGRSTLARGFAGRSSGRITSARQNRDTRKQPFAEEPARERGGAAQGRYAATGYGNDREAAPPPGARGDAGAMAAGAAAGYGLGRDDYGQDRQDDYAPRYDAGSGDRLPPLEDEGPGLGIGRQTEPGSSYRSVYGEDRAADDGRDYERLDAREERVAREERSWESPSWSPEVEDQGAGLLGWQDGQDEDDDAAGGAAAAAWGGFGADDRAATSDYDDPAAAWAPEDREQARARVLTPARPMSDPDRIKRYAVIGLAVVAVILLVFIIRSLFGGGGDPVTSTTTTTAASVVDSSTTTEAISQTNPVIVPPEETSTTASTTGLDEPSEPGEVSVPEPSVSDTEPPVAPTDPPPAPPETTTTTTAATTTTTTTQPPQTTPTTQGGNRNATERSYTVQAGDSLWKIASTNYDIPAGQTVRFMEAIVAANGWADIHHEITPGQTIKLPAVN